MKKKILIVISVLLGIALILTFIPAVIDCGESVLYTKEDRQSAARLISDTVNSFEGCKLYAVKYEGVILQFFIINCIVAYIFHFGYM